jgi:ketosteroid isomerase-like protein
MERNYTWAGTRTRRTGKTTVGSLGYGHSIQRVSGAMRDGKTLDLTVRVTDVYRKIGGKWLIVHEHVSVPWIDDR